MRGFYIEVDQFQSLCEWKKSNDSKLIDGLKVKCHHELAQAAYVDTLALRLAYPNNIFNIKGTVCPELK